LYFLHLTQLTEYKSDLFHYALEIYNLVKLIGWGVKINSNQPCGHTFSKQE